MTSGFSPPTTMPHRLPAQKALAPASADQASGIATLSHGCLLTSAPDTCTLRAYLPQWPQIHDKPAPGRYYALTTMSGSKSSFAIRPVMTTFVSEPQPPRSVCLQTRLSCSQVQHPQLPGARPVLSKYCCTPLLPLRCPLVQSLAPGSAIDFSLPRLTCLGPRIDQ